MALHRDPRERLDSIERHLDRETVDPDLKAEVEEELPAIYREYIALQSEQSFDQHLSKYISDQYKKRQNGGREPLCSCSQPTCPLTNGKVPPQVRYNSDAVLPQKSGRKRALEFIQKHRGAEVLHEVLETWDEREGELHREISKLHMRVVNSDVENRLGVSLDQ